MKLNDAQSYQPGSQPMLHMLASMHCYMLAALALDKVNTHKGSCMTAVDSIAHRGRHTA